MINHRQRRSSLHSTFSHFLLSSHCVSEGNQIICIGFKPINKKPKLVEEKTIKHTQNREERLMKKLNVVVTWNASWLETILLIIVLVVISRGLSSSLKIPRLIGTAYGLRSSCKEENGLKNDGRETK